MEVLFDKFAYRPVDMADLQKPEEKSSGFGIKGKSQPEAAIRFVVVAVGPGKYNESQQTYCPMPLNVGDVFVFPNAANDAVRETFELLPLVDGLKYCVAEASQMYVAVVQRADKGCNHGSDVVQNN